MATSAAAGFSAPGRGAFHLPPSSFPRSSRGCSCKAAAIVLSMSSSEDTFSKYSGYISEVGCDDELKEYSAERVASLYEGRRWVVLRRLLQIGLKVGGWLGLRYVDSMMGRSEKLFKRRVAQLREALVELGPAFVKIAQAVSSRQDVIPPAYVEELSYLQDRIAPFSTTAALKIIEADLGLPVETLFSEISREPIAAASLGQVYQARLRGSGKVVAVKVQRPGVRGAIALDIYILRILAGYAKSAARLNTDLQAVVDEWASSLFREMDYEAEAENGLRFRRLFGRIQDVKVPLMYRELTSRRVLIMEWVEGEKLSEMKDLRLVEVGTYCSLTQLLDSGFYHADPHPGNLMCTYDGKLAYIDFGMMGEIKQDLRDAIIKASLHLVNGEFGALAGDFVDLGFLPSVAPTADVTIALTGIFESAVSRGVSNLSFGDLSGNLGRTMYQFKFRIPSYFSLVIRSLTVLEGIAMSIDPNYKVLGKSYPWIAKKVLTDNSPTLRSTLRDLLYKNGSFQIDRLESLIKESTKWNENAASEVKITETGEFPQRILSFLLSSQGDYVRDIFLDEIVKGLDALNRSMLEDTLSRAGFRTQLMELEDVDNLVTFRRLVWLLSPVPSDAEEALIDPSLTGPTYARWLSIVPQLPLSLQQRLLSLPLDLTGKLISRAVARTIRGSIL